MRKILLSVVTALVVTATLAQKANDTTLYVHLVPHSYNPKVLQQVDDYFPWT